MLRVTWTVLCIAGAILFGHSPTASIAGTSAVATLLSTVTAHAAGSPSFPIWPWTNCYKWEQAKMHSNLVNNTMKSWRCSWIIMAIFGSGEERLKALKFRYHFERCTLPWASMCFARMCLLRTLFLRLLLEVYRATRTSGDSFVAFISF